MVRFRAEATAAAGWPLASLWSRSQAARPTGESAMPYKVWGRDAINLTVPADVDEALQAGDPPPSGLSIEERRAYEQLVRTFKPVDYAYVARVPEALHELRPASRDVVWIPAG
jgi:hypothetical protein